MEENFVDHRIVTRYGEFGHPWRELYDTTNIEKRKIFVYYVRDFRNYLITIYNQKIRPDFISETKEDVPIFGLDD
jgi:hypothetical protein